jgi:hypothetical protein
VDFHVAWDAAPKGVDCFQQHGSHCRMWVPPEIKDPILRHAPTRKSVACFGAVS